MMNNYFNILIGALIVFYIVFNRLFIVRTPRELYSNLDIIKSSVYFIILITMISILLYNCYKLYKHKHNSSNDFKSKYFLYMQTLYQHPRNPLLFWTASLISLDIYLKNMTPDYDEHKNYGHHIIEEIAKFLSKYRSKSLFILLWSRISLQAFVCILFIIDVVIQQKFYYFYKYSWLLIIPMIISYIIYSITFNTDKHLDSLNDMLALSIIAKEDLDSSIPLHDPINFSKAMPITIAQWYEITQREAGEEIYCFNVLKDELISQTTLLEQPDILEYCVDAMNMFFTFKSYITEFNTYKDKIEIPFNIFKYALYVYAWTYIIYYGF